MLYCQGADAMTQTFCIQQSSITYWVAGRTADDRIAGTIAF
jgi:hypothetical protein